MSCSLLVEENQNCGEKILFAEKMKLKNLTAGKTELKTPSLRRKNLICGENEAKKVNNSSAIFDEIDRNMRRMIINQQQFFFLSFQMSSLNVKTFLQSYQIMLIVRPAVGTNSENCLWEMRWKDDHGV
jgi:hypothetical protein